MLTNYLKVALRHLVRKPLYSFITIFGLGAGLACFLLIMLYVQDELSYDAHHTKKDRIYRLVEKIDSKEGQGEHSSSNPIPVGPAIAEEYPHLVEKTVRFFNFQEPMHTLQAGEQKYNEKRVFFADSTALQVFDFPMEAGQAQDALSKPNSIVLTRELARKYFGSENPLGRNIKFDGVLTLTVTGIFAELPEQTHIHFDALASMSSLRQFWPDMQKHNWVWNPCWTYILLKPGVEPAQLMAQMPKFIDAHYPDFIKPLIKKEVQRLEDIHLTSRLDYEIEPNGDKANIYIFSIIGIFILLIASINFMNLSTARSSIRAREVGVRKVVGAHRLELVRQFIFESMLLSAIAVLLALVLVELLLPVFNTISDKKISLSLISHPLLIPSIIGLGLLTGALSGLYPALYLSAFEPVRVLKGRSVPGKAGAGLRKGLVVLQFAVSLVLIISTAIIWRQLTYMRSADTGFQKENVLLMPVRSPMAKAYLPFLEEVRKDPHVISAATMNEVIGANHNTHEFNYEGMQAGKWIYFPALMVSEEFVQTFDIPLVAGRSFSRDFKGDDSSAVLINEAMVRHLNWGSAENAIGKQFYTPLGRERVVGVMKDFNFVSLVNPVGPFVLDIPGKKMKGMFTKYIAIRIKPGNHSETLAALEKIWTGFTKDYPFEYTFLDDNLAKLYRSEENLARLVAGFAILAVLIACLGLFALASYTAEQRTKEIGIRKVVGASSAGLFYLLIKDFGKLVILATVLAVPLAYYFMQSWLENFAFRTSMHPLIFIAGSLLALLIALITVGYQAIRAALSNPVKALRYE